MEEYKVTKERILAAANSCGTAKGILQKMFPEAFEEELEFELGDRIVCGKDTYLIAAYEGCYRAIFVDIDTGKRKLMSIKLNHGGKASYLEVSSAFGGYVIRKITDKQYQAII